MDVDVAMDVTSVDIGLLQLPEIPPFAVDSTPLPVNDLFSQWLSLPDTNRLVKTLLSDDKAGAAPNSGSLMNATASPTNSLPSMFKTGNAPPLSPRSMSGSPRFMKLRSGPSSLGSPLKIISEPVREVIPKFYFKDGRPAPKELKEQCLCMIDQVFQDRMEGLRVKELKTVTKEICKLPSFFNEALFKKIDVNSTGTVTRDAFINYWITNHMLTMGTTTQIYNILKQPNCNYLTQSDFKPVLRELLITHPGLEFLQSTPEFQERYAETVIYRIFYYINRAGNGHLTLRELKHGDLIAAMQHVDEEEDINKVLRLAGLRSGCSISFSS